MWLSCLDPSALGWAESGFKVSLKAFHIFFIAVSILMSLYVGAWSTREYLDHGSSGALALASTSFLLGFVLVIYGIRVFRKLQALEK